MPTPSLGVGQCVTQFSEYKRKKTLLIEAASKTLVQNADIKVVYEKALSYAHTFLGGGTVRYGRNPLYTVVAYCVYLTFLWKLYCQTGDNNFLTKNVLAYFPP
jgi:hypothetical protein